MQTGHRTPDTGQDADEADAYSAQSAAAALGVNERTIRRAIARGELRAAKRSGAFRIARRELERLQRRRQAALGRPRAQSGHRGAQSGQAARMPWTDPRGRGPASARPTGREIIGREREIAEVRDLLMREDVGLLTLTGPGGIGKTRLALAAATGLGRTFPDGVWFVGLAPLDDPELVPLAIARALGVREGGVRSLADRLARYLRGRRALLLLDNFERVAPGAPRVAALLAASPELRVLVTSRVALNVSGEHRYAVPPLALPDAADAHDPGAIAASEAVRLFVARARLADPGFELGEGNVAAIAAVCARLEGQPLAIELAAARCAVLSPAALRARLAPSLPLLVGGFRDQPERLRSMRHAVAWSYDLLDADARRVFRRLAVFLGGCTLEAVEAVAGTAGRASGDDGEASRLEDAGESIVPVLETLVESSLVRRLPGLDGEPRFGMLETVREFGLERLADSGELEGARAAHAAWFAAFAEQEQPYRPGQSMGIDDVLWRVEAEHANLRAALGYLASSGDADGLMRLAGALAPFWFMRGHLREARRWLGTALEWPARVPTASRCRAILGWATILWSQGSFEQAGSEARRALAMAELLGDGHLAAGARHMLGLAAYVRHRWDEAERLIEEARVEWQGLGERLYEGSAMLVLGLIAYDAGDQARASVMAKRALAMLETIGDDFGADNTHNLLARLARDRGDDSEALLEHRHGLERWVRIDARWTALASASPAAIETVEAEFLAHWPGDEDARSIIRSLGGVARIAAVHGQPELGARLAGAADGLKDAAGALVFGTDKVDDHASAVAASTAALGEARVKDLRAAGRSMPLRAAVADALAVTTSPNAVGTKARDDRQSLTRREREVLKLIAAGHTDKEIAAILFVSPHTAASHVAHILDKLDLPSRAAAAAFAVRHDLG